MFHLHNYDSCVWSWYIGGIKLNRAGLFVNIGHYDIRFTGIELTEHPLFNGMGNSFIIFLVYIHLNASYGPISIAEKLL